MKNRHCFYLILCTALVIANVHNFDLFSRIALGMTGLALLLDFAVRLRRINHA